MMIRRTLIYMGRNRTLGSPYETQFVTTDVTTESHVDAYYCGATNITITLDPGAAVGDQVFIQDFTNSASGTQPITIVASPGQSVVGNPSIAIKTPLGGILLTFILDPILGLPIWSVSAEVQSAASDVFYFAASATNWNNNPPQTVQAALDRIAAHVGPVP